MLEHYQKGINLGGWISQPVSYDEIHFESFITQQDIEDIANMGFDHVRLPVDYDVIQNEDETFIESRLQHIDNCIQWVRQHNLHMILDLHKTAGYSFDKQETSHSFFSSETLQNRFISLWDFLSERYEQYEDILAFEILNEVVDTQVAQKWNEIAKRCMLTIRNHAPTIKILVGGVASNSVKSITLLEPPIDENIVYNFHCYEPLIFTHQQAYWVKGMPPNLKIAYPNTAENMLIETKKINAFYPSPLFEINATGKLFFQQLFEDAITYAERYNVPLYCGEFGVIALANPSDALVWFTDIVTILRKYNIGYAMWNYKNKDFGLVDDFIQVKDRLVKTIV